MSGFQVGCPRVATGIEIYEPAKYVKQQRISKKNILLTSVTDMSIVWTPSVPFSGFQFDRMKTNMI
jgi:hypothetical protein